MVSQSEVWSGADLEPGTVAIVEWLSRVRGDLTGPIQLAIAQKSFPQNGALDLQLGLIIRVLVMAAAALAKVRAWRLHTFSGRLEDLGHYRAGETALLPGNGGVNLLTGKHKGQKHGLSIREVGQTVPPVDHLFNCKIHM